MFKLAIEENNLDTIAKESQAVLTAIRENEDFIKLLNHPKISREEKISVVEKVFKGNVSDSIVGFLVIIVEKGRYTDIEAIFEYFLAQVKEYKNIGVASITSAVPLTEEQKKMVLDRLLKVTKYVQFEIHYAVDESLIGGMVIRIGDRVVDSSIRTKLTTMAGELRKIQLN